jgi:four helix bundle protein
MIAERGFRIAELNTVKSDDLKQRTKQFALRAIRMSESMPRSLTGDALNRQFVRSATSVAANYRSACRGRSRAEFIAKMGLVEEEADETAFWLELIAESGLMPQQSTIEMHREAGELTAIAVSSIRTARVGKSNPQSAIRSPQPK